MKICLQCYQEKSLEEFYKDEKNTSNVGSYCKQCSDRRNEDWRKQNKERLNAIRRKTRLRKAYGITPEQYEDILSKQNGCCAICERPASRFVKRLAVDHIHKGPRAGFIRGLLCDFCNRRQVGSHIDGDLLRRIADYVDQDIGIKVPDDMINPKKKRKK